MSLLTPYRRQKQIRDFFIQVYGKQFDKEVDFENRIDVRPDTLVYNLEDRYVWDQHKGKVPTYFTVYFDDVYICGFGEDQSPQEVNLAFWKGMRETYKSGKIRLNKGLAEKERLEREALIKKEVEEQNKKIDDLPEFTPVQKLAKATIRRVKNAKAGKPSTNAK